MNELRICFEVNGLAADEDGNPCPAGMQISFGKTDKEVNYTELIKDISIPAFAAYLNDLGLTKSIRPEDVRIISPEEYDEKYGEGA